jgi:hypothetical protein
MIYVTLNKFYFCICNNAKKKVDLHHECTKLLKEEDGYLLFETYVKSEFSIENIYSVKIFFFLKN